MNQDFSKSDFIFFKNIDARWSDMDSLRHINHATYLSYFETARIEYLATLGFDLIRWETDKSVILASMKIDYHRQSSFPSSYEVGCLISRVGSKSFDIFTALYNSSNPEPIVTGTFTVVMFNYLTQQTIPVTDRVKNEHFKLLR